jgi:hypothetical protein
MPWYQSINAKSESYIADRDAEALLRQGATALQAADGPVDADVLYGRTTMVCAATMCPCRSRPSNARNGYSLRTM